MSVSAVLVVAVQEIKLRQKHEISRTVKIFFIYPSISKLKLSVPVSGTISPDCPEREVHKAGGTLNCVVYDSWLADCWFWGIKDITSISMFYKNLELRKIDFGSTVE